MEPLLEVDEPVVQPDREADLEAADSTDGSVRPTLDSSAWYGCISSDDVLLPQLYHSPDERSVSFLLRPSIAPSSLTDSPV